MSSFTCKGCDSRHSGCHGTCEKYNAEKKAWDEMQSAIRKKKAVEDGLNRHLIETMRKNKARTGIQKPYRSGGQ